MSAENQPIEDVSVSDHEILAILIQHDLVTRTADETLERQPENVMLVIDRLRASINREVAGKLLEQAERMYFKDPHNSTKDLNSDQIKDAVAAHMSQTGGGFKPPHSNAHLVAAMSIALDWIAEASARELPTVKVLALRTRQLGRNRQGH